MEKDSGQYCYETYPAVSKQNTNSLKREPGKRKKGEDVDSCKCFGAIGLRLHLDLHFRAFFIGSKKKSKSKAFLTGLATNFGICTLLFGYTLVGSVIFLAIEGGGSHVHQHQILATTSNAIKGHKRYFNSSAELRKRNEEARERTVESIWDITVNLNILYRDNWTKLAAQEITRFV